jgi:uracil-DNA glycosylase family 4
MQDLAADSIMRVMSESLEELLREVRGCRLCEARLPHGPRPTLRARNDARLLVVGQAPGMRVHRNGVPWNDRSGTRLRKWMQVASGVFYDETKIAIVPIAFCYPGTGASGDLPPRRECAPFWHPRLQRSLPRIELVLLVGSHAQKYYLGSAMKASVSETVRSFREYLPRYFALPHPSWHNNHWVKRNAWFSSEVLPELASRVRSLVR